MQRGATEGQAAPQSPVLPCPVAHWEAGLMQVRGLDGWRWGCVARYVGGAPGKIDLYVGKEVVRRGIPMDGATEGLVELIKEVRRPQLVGWFSPCDSACWAGHDQLRGWPLVPTHGVSLSLCNVRSSQMRYFVWCFTRVLSCCSTGAGRSQRRRRRTSRPLPKSAWRRGPSLCRPSVLYRRGGWWEFFLDLPGVASQRSVRDKW